MEDIDDREIVRAPLRAHILASINPCGGDSTSSTPDDWSRRHRPRRKRPCSRERTDRSRSPSGNAGGDGEDDSLRPRKSRIRFKRRDRSGERGEDGTDEGRSRSRSRSEDHRHKRHSRRHRDESRHRHHHHHHRRRHHHRRHRDEDPNAKADPDPDPPLDEDAAFRQSLFDAMADDEGAAFWEGVYGQPVHEYAQEAAGGAGAAGGGKTADPAGLAAMTDDEYAAYVRQRMWERSDEGRRYAAQKAAAERAAREHAADREADKKRERERQRAKAKQADAAYWAEVDRSLKRGQARRQRKQWQERWQAYAAAWTKWEKAPTVATIPWPGGVEGAKSESSDGDDETAYAKAVQAFFTGDEDAKQGLQTRLRDERVRWHPDKMQQRLGGSVDVEAMRQITAIFQVVDRLWGEVRGK